MALATPRRRRLPAGELAALAGTRPAGVTLWPPSRTVVHPATVRLVEEVAGDAS